MLGALGGLAAARVLRMGTAVPELPPADVAFPRRADFAIAPATTYLNAAYTHPIPRVSSEAARVAAERRAAALPAEPDRASPKQLFARLINAKPSEIAHVSSTSAGENLVMRALGLDHRFDGNVVTDGLHFEGALMHLDTLKRKGLDVRIARPTDDGRVELRDLERLIDRRTRLVQVSAAAMYNGFRHDLRAIADLAHAQGALVYVDLVHLAGAEPFDVAASGIDFAACSSFKWLMGDFGLGFLYARESAWDRIERPVVGYYQAAEIDQHVPPFLPAGAHDPVEYAFARGAAGHLRDGRAHRDGRGGGRPARAIAGIRDGARPGPHPGPPRADDPPAAGRDASPRVPVDDPRGLDRRERDLRAARRGRERRTQAPRRRGRRGARRGRLAARVAVRLQRPR